MNFVSAPWRSLSTQQENEIIELLREGKGRTVTVFSLGDPEGHRLAQQLKTVFERAGWKTGFTVLARVPAPAGITFIHGPTDLLGRHAGQYLLDLGWVVNGKVLDLPNMQLEVHVNMKPPAWRTT